MKTTRIGVLFLLSLVCSLNPGAKEPDQELQSGYRHHFRGITQEGGALRITLISRAGHLGPTAVGEPVLDRVLLMSPDGEKWIASSESRGPKDDEGGFLAFDLSRLTTGERISIRCPWEHSGQEAVCKLRLGSETLSIPYERRASQRPQIESLLQSRYSTEFLNGLSLFRALAYGVRGLPIDRTLFEVIFGEPSREAALPTYDLERVPVDCSFDAAFGFPCEEGEKPNNPKKKALVLEGPENP